MLNDYKELQVIHHCQLFPCPAEITTSHYDNIGLCATTAPKTAAENLYI